MEDINRVAELVELGIEPSKKENDYVLYLKNETSKHYVYSKYNPRKTAKDLVDFENANEETIWIIFGMGLGYVAEEILEGAGLNSKIILIEPTEKLVEKQRPYMEQLLKHERINLFYGNNQKELNKILEHVIKVKDINNIKVIVQPVYRSYFKTYYQYVLAVISEYIESLKVTYNTIKAFSYTNLNNLIQNEESIRNSCDISHNRDQYKDIPAVIVSAGPSLNKNISELKNFKGVIFTGTRSLPAIKEVGVTPHYLVCVDPGEIACDIMREYKENEITLIATEEASPKVIQNNGGRKYFIKGMTNGLSKTLYDVDVPKLPLYGSVATLCLSAAQFMGCNPIIFIGQDLAYTGGKSHAEDDINSEVDLEEHHIRYVQGMNGEVIPTDVTLLSFLRWIETFIDENSKDTQYINCTEGGANIRGAENAVFKEIIERYNKDYVIKEKDVVKTRSGSLHCKEKVILELKDYMKVLKKGITYCNQLQEEYQLCQDKNNHKINQLKAVLDKEVNNKFHNINSLFEMIFTIERLKVEVNLQYKNQFDAAPIERDLKNVQKFLELYSSTYEEVQRILEIIEA